MRIDLSEDPWVVVDNMQPVPVEILLTKKERREFRIASIEEGSSMRQVGRKLIRDWLKARSEKDANAK